MSLRFDDQVAVVTGAGGGLGRAHALELARRGAKLVINDLGGAVDGTGGSSEAAEKVVAEIKAMGGQAIANGSSVSSKEGVALLVKETLDAFGRCDILINNAGVLRDKSFSKVSLEDFEFVVDVHLMGAVYVTKAFWPVMREQQYGRIIMTTSSTGLYGNFGQTNYGAAKLAQVGFMNTLKLEGQRDNIHVNTICPVAATRMTEDLMPPEALDMLKPEFVTPAVIVLCAKDAPTGVILTAGAGVFAQSKIVETRGVGLGRDASLTAEKVLENWDRITDDGQATAYFQGGEQTMKFFELANSS
ncbi:MAG: SDR family oxidoreductase [Alphaproteobacteria bacterium]